MVTELQTTIIPLVVDILKAVISIVFTVVIIPWVLKYAIPWMKEKRIYSIVKKLVRAAEKLGDAGTISKESKLEYVVTLLNKMHINVDANVRALIESAVGDLDDELTHNMMSLIEAINGADDASEFFFEKGKITEAEMDSRMDDDDEEKESNN